MKHATRFVFMALAATTLGCAARSQPPQAQQPVAQAQAAGQAPRAAQGSEPGRSPERFIYVTAQGLPGACYHELGVVQFTEPFTDAAIDPDNSNAADHLRALALQRYPNQADAVIGLQSRSNDVGTLVTVSGTAVELRKGETVECAMRQVPGTLDTVAASAAGGVVGALAGGLAGGGPTATMAGGAGGVAVVGSYLAYKHHKEAEAEHDRLLAQLQAQRRQIAELQAQRAGLEQCLANETPVDKCKPAPPPAPSAAEAHATEAADWSAQPYELQRQIQEQQVYIKKLREQVLDARHQLSGNQ